MCGSQRLIFYLLLESIVLNFINTWKFTPFQLFNSNFNLNRTQLTS
jgi:hypothetical protein